MIHRSGRASPGAVQRLAAQLHHAIGVGHRAGFLGPCGRRQNNVGVIAGFGQEDFLHHEMIELGQRLARVMRVGVRHRRVFAHDVHAADLAGVHRVHDLDHGQARLGIECRAPQLFEARERSGIVDALVIRKHHRDQARVRRALHVVLAAQRMQAGAGAADLAGHHAQRDQAARVVGAVDVLRDAHAPQDHRALRFRIQARHRFDRVGRNAAHRRHRLRAVIGDVAL